MRSFYCYLVLFFLLFFSCNKEFPTELNNDDDIPMTPDMWYDITPDKSLVYNDVYFLDSQQGWIAARKHVVGTGHRGVVLITKDGGASWNEVVLSDAHDLEFVYFFNNVSGVGFALTDGIFKSNDGGLTWVYTPYYIWGLRGIEGSDENTLWGLRSWIGGTFFMKSLDQGSTWDEVESSRRDDDLHALFLSMSMPTPNCIYMAGHYDPNEDLTETIIHLIVCSYDNGATWEEKYLPQELIPARTWVHSIEFLTESYGWIGGEYRTMLHTIDGGTTWEQQNTGSGTDCFYDIDAIDEEHIIAVTSDGAILITRSGGEFWEESIPVDSLTSQFRKVQYLDSNIAYVIGRDVVLKAKISR